MERLGRGFWIQKLRIFWRFSKGLPIVTSKKYAHDALTSIQAQI